ncbi:MAG: hypothetical protein M3R63_16570 [Actinomycetota bacterium]|nr:hypothetical protein [Actinomycetota bacterium]
MCLDCAEAIRLRIDEAATTSLFPGHLPAATTLEGARVLGLFVPVNPAPAHSDGDDSHL